MYMFIYCLFSKWTTPVWSKKGLGDDIVGNVYKLAKEETDSVVDTANGTGTATYSETVTSLNCDTVADDC